MDILIEKSSEWCGICGEEANYTFNIDNPVVKCRGCGEYLVMCNMCDHSNDDSNKCLGCKLGSNFKLLEE